MTPYFSSIFFTLSFMTFILELTVNYHKHVSHNLCQRNKTFSSPTYLVYLICMKLSKTMVLLGTEAFLSPLSWLQPPWLSLSSKGQIRTVANPGREGMQRQGNGSQETILQAWGRVLVLPQGIHIPMSLSSLRCQHSSYQRKIIWGYMKGTREAHQEDHLRPE